MASGSKISEGSFVLVDYSVEDAETGNLIDTTMEKVAEEKKFTGRDQFFPMLVIIGEKRLLPSIEKVITEMKEGETKTLILKPEEAYGPYEESKVVTFSLERIKKALGSSKIKPGVIITLDNKRGVIRSVSGGRVKVDFNHPLAGKTLKVNIKLSKVLRTKEEKIKALSSDIFDVDPSKFEVSVNGTVATIELPKLAYSKRDAFIRKIRLLSSIMKYLPEIERVKFVETFDIPKESDNIH
ncbi:MAG TPA: peptidylprolyl isomerase [Candidatus Korarchaeota archaeon]|nr:peptidylprolyl isomerase [Candidatus Korarchaeota archaeon]